LVDYIIISVLGAGINRVRTDEKTTDSCSGTDIYSWNLNVHISDIR
jgi:hypothetical protein